MSQRTVVFSLPGHEALGARLATGLKAAEGALTLRQFPDGETYVRGETPCEGLDVVLARVPPPRWSISTAGPVPGSLCMCRTKSCGHALGCAASTAKVRAVSPATACVHHRGVMPPCTGR